MLGLIEIRCRNVGRSVRNAHHHQSPLVGVCSGVIEEVVQQDLDSVKVYDIFCPTQPTSLNSRPLLSYNVLEWRVLYRHELTPGGTHMIMLLSPNLSLSRFLASVFRTRIPAFSVMSRFLGP